MKYMISDDTKRKSVAHYKSDDIHDELLDLMDLLISTYEKKDMKKMKQYLDESREYRKKYTILLNESRNQEELSICKFVQTYNIFNELYRFYLEKESTSEKIEELININSKTKDIIVYLYNNNFAQPKNIKEKVNISGSTLSDILKRLVNYQCVNKKEMGRCSFYNLAPEVSLYIEAKGLNKRSYIDYIDYKSFKKSTNKIVEEYIGIDKGNDKYNMKYWGCVISNKYNKSCL